MDTRVSTLDTRVSSFYLGEILVYQKAVSRPDFIPEGDEWKYPPTPGPNIDFIPDTPSIHSEDIEPNEEKKKIEQIDTI
jgi:hypothetical protein